MQGNRKSCKRLRRSSRPARINSLTCTLGQTIFTNNHRKPSLVQRNFTQMSLFSHRISPPIPTTTSYSSKPIKPEKPNSTLPSNRTPMPIVVFSLISLLIGIAGSIFAITAITRPRPVPVFRCGRSEDTFRAFYSLTGSRKLGDGDISGRLIDRPKLLGFVGIQTGFESGYRRAALRSTWFPSDSDGLLRLEQATGLAFRFVIGRSKDAKKMAQLQKEIDKYRDFMLIDVEEDYLKLPYKTLSFFKAAFKLFEAEYYVKADDDIYLRPDRLATLLAKERTHSLTYIGCMKKGSVITDPKMKWYEKAGHLIGNEYFLHAYGPIYVLSAEIVASLEAARNNSLRMFSNEDVTIGSWMLAMNVHHEDNRAICDPRCTPTSIAVWDIPKCSGLCNPAIRLKELFTRLICAPKVRHCLQMMDIFIKLELTLSMPLTLRDGLVLLKLQSKW